MAAARAQLRALEEQFYKQFAVPGKDSVNNVKGEEKEDEEDEDEDEEDEDEDHVKEDDDEEDDEDDEDEDEDEDDYESGENNEDLDDDEDLLQAAMSSRPPAPKAPAQAPAPTKPRRVPETVVFSDKPSAPAAPLSASARRNFMVRHTPLTQSSKIEKIDAKEESRPTRADEDEDEEEDQRANDRKLAELLSTSLFAPGSSSSSQKRKLTTTTNETLARVMELSTTDTLDAHAAGSGWGDKQLRAQDLGKMPARIRAGLRRAAGERREREIATQKELGLWNPKLQSHSQQSRGTATERGSKATQPKQRARGIGSGIGSFRGGTLHLSDADVRRIQGPKRAKTQGKRPGRKST